MMNEQEAKFKLIDYLYDEMTKEERREFEKVLSESPELQRELREMQSTRNLLKEEPGEIPHKSLLLINPETPEKETPTEQKSQSTFFYLKTAAAIAAVILLTVTAFAFINLQIQQTEQGVLISFGDQPVTEQPLQENQISEEEVYSLIGELHEENSRLFSEVLEETRREHRQQLEDVISTLTTYYDQRRRQDLILISEGLAQLEEETYYRFLQTEEALEDLIFALSYQQPEE